MELSDIDTLALTLRGQTLEEATAYLMERKMVELEEIAAEAGIEKPASTKTAVAEQIIAKLTSNEDANVEDSGLATAPDGEAGDSPSTPPANDPTTPVDDAPDGADEASLGQGVLPREGRGEGVSLPAKVAAMPLERLWPEILGWEIDQGLDESAQAAFSEDELREYLGYLWTMGALGQDPKEWARIEDYEFRGLSE